MLNSAEKQIRELKKQLADAFVQTYCTICGKTLENCDGTISLVTNCTLHPRFIFDMKEPWCPCCLMDLAIKLQDEKDCLQDDNVELRRRLNELEEDRR